MNSEGGKPGNVLTVNGNYTGNNGLMTFNATLGGDNSPTDKMNVKGDTQGNTRVRVDNIGGVGAQTVNGIELIEVGGNSAGNFALTTGTVEAGAYVYTLAKGKGNDEKNWYLTSKWDGVTPADTPDPINNPPVVDPEGPSVYRPEAGSYISNIAAANSLFSHRLHDRLGEPQYTDSLHSQDSASSMWMRHVGGHERSSAGDGQLNTQANRYVLQLGGDLAQWSSNAQDRWHLGVMAGYANQHSNTQSNRVGYKSDGRISGYSAGLYATWYQNDANKTGAYVDSWALYNWFDNSVSSDNRSADDYDSRGVTASVEGGYTFEAGTCSGSEGTLNTWYVQPQAQITWMGVKDSDHARKDGTRIETEGDGNVQTRLGVKTYLNSHHQRDDGKQREFQPYIEANWINNSKVYAVKMNGQTVSRDGARNRQPNATLDLSQSVDNEYYCLLLAKELGLNVPDAEIIKAGNVRALAVERFDRRWNAERTVLLRLPQEDMCQTFGLPSSVKYESDGGPGIARIMAFLMGFSEALRDRYDFMKFQVFQWLIGATDGHAKNFSVFIQAGGSYRLTPFYDIISAFPVLGGTGIHISDLKLAMGLNASKGKKTAIDKIYPRHFLATAKVLRFPEVQMHEILSDFARMIPAALDNVKTSLPTDFPENVVTAVETNVLRLHGRLSREYGIK
nr:autotransporter outer membrane beta-barrel domain-containing protein [Escherichia coli]EFD7601493.1 autotransporter outer membrane beta-barrel domain-containing protein [Escherichia coli]